jgi:hypothetical protein
MAFTRYLALPSVISFDRRCAKCRSGMDRDGRYCSRCLTGYRFKLFFGALAGVQVAAAAILLLQPHVPSRPAIVSDPTPPSVVPSITAMSARAGWQYYDVTDPLINDVTHHARLIAADGGAEGRMRGVLELAVSPHYGTSVVLTFPPVRKSCSAAPCEVRAMFDGRAPVKIPFQDLSNDHASVLMLGDKDGFMSKLPSAHDLTIMASFGGAPETVISFNVAGLRMTLASLQARIRMAAAKGQPPA